MSELATQREHWDSHPVELGDAWTLRKGQRFARCALYSHPFGWELRLMVVGTRAVAGVSQSGRDSYHAGELEAGDAAARVALSGRESEAVASRPSKLGTIPGTMLTRRFRLRAGWQV